MTAAPPGEHWRLEGYDVFSDEEYPLGGYKSDYRPFYSSYEEALRDARRRLAELNSSQPDAGGQAPDGIQDRVYIVHPGGRKERVS